MISYETTLAFAAIATLIVVAPGPATFLLLKNTPVQGTRAGLLNTVGIVAAVLSHATLSMAGLSALVLASPIAFKAVKFAAAGYLLYLGALACLEAWRGIDYAGRLQAQTAAKSFTTAGAISEGWLLNILTPKPSMFYLSIFPQFLDPSGNVVAQGAILAGLHAAISAAWFSFVVLGIDRIKLLLQQPALWRCIRLLTGLILISFAARLATLQVT